MGLAFLKMVFSCFAVIFCPVKGNTFLGWDQRWSGREGRREGGRGRGQDTQRTTLTPTLRPLYHPLVARRGTTGPLVVVVGQEGGRVGEGEEWVGVGGRGQCRRPLGVLTGNVGKRWWPDTLGVAPPNCPFLKDLAFLFVFLQGPEREREREIDWEMETEGEKTTHW